jgi:hypothetical protein
MKLNQRDKIVLIGVLVILIWVCGVMFFIKPAIQSVSEASNTLDSKEIELAELNAQIDEDKNLPQETQDAYDTAKETADVFYDKMPQYDAMHIVQQMLEDKTDDDSQAGSDAITNLNLYITEMTVGTLEKYTYNPDVSSTQIDNIIAGNLSTDETSTDATIDVTSVDVSTYGMSFEFECTKKSLLKFITNLQTNSQKSLVITALEIDDVGDNEESTEIAGEMSLQFMMIPDIMTPEEAQEQDVLGTDATEVNATEAE